MKRRTLRLVPEATPAVHVDCSAAAARSAAVAIERALDARWSKGMRACLLYEILARCQAQKRADGSVHIIAIGE